MHVYHEKKNQTHLANDNHIKDNVYNIHYSRSNVKLKQSVIECT